MTLGAATASADPARQVFFGDTHLHTSYSFDAFLNGNRSADPDTAYRWAKGLPVIHPYHRARVRIKTPLDFLVVADHAEYLGMIRKLYFDVREGPGAEFANRVREAIDSGKGQTLFTGVLPAASTIAPGDYEESDLRRRRAESAPDRIPALESLHVDAWAETTTAADRHNDPGRFTALIGWEWSSIPSGANLHRVVMTPSDGRDRSPLHALRLGQELLPRGPLEVPRADDEGDWRPVRRDPAQLEHLEGLHVRRGDPRRVALYHGERPDPGALGAGHGGDPVQGHLGDPSRPLPERSLRRLRDLHAATSSRTNSPTSPSPATTRARR